MSRFSFAILSLLVLGPSVSGESLSPIVKERLDRALVSSRYSHFEVGVGAILASEDEVAEGWENMVKMTLGNPSDIDLARFLGSLDGVLETARLSLAAGEYLVEESANVPAFQKGTVLAAARSLAPLLESLDEIRDLDHASSRALYMIGAYVKNDLEAHERAVGKARRVVSDPFGASREARSMIRSLATYERPADDRRRSPGPGTEAETATSAAAESPELSPEERARRESEYADWLEDQERRKAARLRWENELARRDVERREAAPAELPRLSEGASTIEALEQRQSDEIDARLRARREEEERIDLRAEMKGWYDSLYASRSAVIKTALRDALRPSASDPGQRFRRCADLGREAHALANDHNLRATPVSDVGPVLQELYSALAELGFACAEGGDPAAGAQELQPLFQRAAEALAPYGLAP